jgi:anti-anti-sigma factor
MDPGPVGHTHGRPHDPSVVALIGDVDLANARMHGDLLCRLLDLGHEPELVVDCSELEFLDSQGLAMMYRVHRHGVAHGTPVRWVEMSDRHRRLLQLTGLEGHLDVAPVEGA